jgi:dCTP deaminase
MDTDRLTAPMIVPFTDSQVEPASYDVCLGNDFLVFERDDTPFIDMRNPKDITKNVTVLDNNHFTMHPGEFALARTAETVNIPIDLVARIEGKSSVGRLGMMIHITAGYIDPGFRGPITLELYCVHPLPVLIYPGDRIAQLSFHEMSSTPSRAYAGRYQDAESVQSSRYGELPKGARPVVPGRAWYDTMVEGETRTDPDDGNTYVKQEDIDSETVHITDIFGGHVRYLPVGEWESWEKVA